MLIVNISGHIPGKVRFRQRLPGAVVGECPYRAIAFCLFSVPKRFTKI